MAKKDKEFDDLIAKMMARIDELDPKLLDDISESLMKRSDGEGFEVLDELRDLKSNKHEKPTVEFLDMDLPDYVDFWDYYEDRYPQEDYDAFMSECRRMKQRKKGQLAKDINAFLESVPVYYAEDYTIISHQLWMVAAAVAKFDLKECHLPFINLLRCEDFFIQDALMDDEIGSINMYAELCHDHLKELFDVAIDERVMPFARGVAIGAIAKSAIYSPKDQLLITGYLRQIIETYRERVADDRKVAVTMIRATSLIIARMHFTSLMPLITETYRKLRIRAKGPGTISRVEALMNDENETLGKDEKIVDYIEGFLKFQEMIGNPYADDYDDDDEYADYEEVDDEEDEPFDFTQPKKKSIRKDRYSIEQMRKVNTANGKVKILGQDMSEAHPKGLAITTDRDYLNFANGIVGRISGMAHDLSPMDIKTIAMKCTLYFEDVIADAGIWRSFVETMRKMYGKPLPFYAVDEKNYYSDEPNLEDVKLLVWLARLDSHQGGVANPENPVMMKMAEVIYGYMEEMFEKMPINEALADYFRKAEFIKDFYQARDAVKWVYLSNYLTSTTNALNTMIDEANMLYNIYGEEAFYQAESTLIFTEHIGPLALYAKDWLAMILESNGNKKAAQMIRDMEGTTTAYHIKERGDNLFGNYSLERPDGVLMEFDQDGFERVVNNPKGGDYVYGCIIRFDDKWYLSGCSMINNRLKELYDEQVEKLKHNKNIGCPNYDKVMKKNGGSKLFYFKDTDAVKKFVTKELGMRLKDVSVPLLDTYHEYWLVFIPDASGNLLFVPEVATLICDKKNPYYDEEVAKEDRFNLILNMPYALSSYIMEHNLLPFAGFVSIEGDEKGRQQLQENYDFVIRCLAPEHMDMPSVKDMRVL